MNFITLSISICCIAILSACSTSEWGSISTDTVTREGFSMKIPTTWTEVSSKQLPEKIKAGTVVLAYTSTDISSGFANNLSVIQWTLQQAVTSKDYAMNNYVRTTAHLKNHTKLATTSMQFPDKENGIIYTYEAQYNPSTPLQKFMQSAKVCNNRVYLITLGLGPQAQWMTKYEELIRSFECQ